MLAQIPGTDRLVSDAAAHSWEAAAVAVILLVLLGTIGWLIRVLWVINQRLSVRVDKLELSIEEKLIKIVENTTATIAANTEVMNRAANAIDKLEVAVEQSQQSQVAILARIEASPCLMRAVFSKETAGILDDIEKEALERFSK